MICIHAIEARFPFSIIQANRSGVGTPGALGLSNPSSTRRSKKLGLPRRCNTCRSMPIDNLHGEPFHRTCVIRHSWVMSQDRRLIVREVTYRK